MDNVAPAITSVVSPSGPLALGSTASFGFVSKYQKGATIPTSETEFQFKAGDLHFHSEAYEWLVVAGACAQYKGTGKINNAGEYGFLITAVDDQVTGGNAADQSRIKIWNKQTGATVYDNRRGQSDDMDAMQPQPLPQAGRSRGLRRRAPPLARRWRSRGRSAHPVWTGPGC